MTTNQILTASFLDILFENRNKAYGAYEIRKAYPKNLMKALGMMLLLVFSVSIYVMSKPKKNGGICLINPSHDTLEITLTNHQPDKPIQPQQSRTVPAQPPTRIDAPPIIVPDHTPIDNPVPDRTDTTTYVPGSTNSPGTGTDGRNIVQGTVGDSTRVAPQHVPPIEPDEPAIRDVAEVQPEFPGGEQAWLNYLQRMLRVPDELEPGERKTVRIKFVVNANGEVTDAIVTQSAGASFDKEVLRVIAKMPKWKPGRQKGKPVAVYFTQPVTFATIEE